MGIVSAVCGILYEIYFAHVDPLLRTLWLRIEPHYEVAKKVAVGLLVAFTILFVSLCISAILFGTIYFYNMPTIYYSFPLKFEYNRACMQRHKRFEKFGGHSRNIYSKECFPVSTLPLGYADNYKLLQVGQSYSVVAKIEIPETPGNLDIESFMFIMEVEGHNTTNINIQFKEKQSKKYRNKELEEKPVVSKFRATNSVAIKYKSLIIKLINVALFWPFYLFDFYQETQTFDIVLFDQLILNPAGLNWIARIYIDHPSITVNHAKLDVTLRFSGIQSLLYHWPVVSFVFGTAIVFPIVLCIVVAALYFFVWKVFFKAVAPTSVGRRNERRERTAVTDNLPSAPANTDEVTTDVISSSFVISDSIRTSSRRSSSSSSSIEMIGHSRLSTQGSESSFLIPSNPTLEASEPEIDAIDTTITESNANEDGSFVDPQVDTTVRRRQVL
uniref:Seipin n=1 Tax=Ciona intestinalis TaxID=7719 RepID=H2XXZ8_CIOIN|nr:seipin [Ciona intestinalis]|eukprot:XP_002126509.1 seipin [Ciona intestinalis]